VTPCRVLRAPMSGALHVRGRVIRGRAALQLRGLPVRRFVYDGDPESQIAAFVSSEDVQLVVMATHGRPRCARVDLWQPAALPQPPCHPGTAIGYEFTGTVDGNKMSGEINMGEYGPAKWSAVKRG